WVEISVADDGRGIDATRVRSRALELKIATQQELETVDDSAALNFLFEPGFSTAEGVSELAGRGVGLDIVKSHLMRLGGEASIESQPGAGTQVLLRVPLTRLTTSGIIIRVGDQLFALSTSDVEQTLKVRREDVAMADGTEAISVRGQLVRVIDLASVLGYTSTELAEMPCVVIGDGGRRRAVLVDEVLGQRDYILQQLSWNLSGAPTVSGTAVLDGATVVLVLDSHALLGSRSITGGVWSQTPEARQLRILVVDDSATSRTLERNILQTAGYDVITAIDGNEALSVLRREQIDLVISDVEMPVIDGFELTRRIRQEAELERLPVVLVTSLGSDDHKRTGAEVGADAYIVKGAFDQDELLKTVTRLL
ncbi:MAG: response regulator, partial [bacterium]|nr:response regulator [bacterium]